MKKIINHRVKSVHKFVEGETSGKKENLQIVEGWPMRRMLINLNNTRYLINKFSNYNESNPTEESEMLESPAKQRKFKRLGGWGRGGLVEYSFVFTF